MRFYLKCDSEHLYTYLSAALEPEAILDFSSKILIGNKIEMKQEEQVTKGYQIKLYIIFEYNTVEYRKPSKAIIIQLRTTTAGKNPSICYTNKTDNLGNVVMMSSKSANVNLIKIDLLNYLFLCCCHRLLD
jgi:hypothetical protein